MIFAPSVSTIIPQIGSFACIDSTRRAQRRGPHYGDAWAARRAFPKSLNPRDGPVTVVRDVSVEELRRRLAEEPDGFVLLDVREDDEREFARITPSLHIPMDSLPTRRSELPTDREIVVYCHTGGRSMMVAGYLEAHGFGRVANLRGGIDAWSRRVDPNVPVY